MADYEDEQEVLEPEAPAADEWQRYVKPPEPPPQQVAQASVQTGVQSDAEPVQTAQAAPPPAQAAAAPPAEAAAPPAQEAAEEWFRYVNPNRPPAEEWFRYTKPTKPDESGVTAMVRELGYGAVPAFTGAVTGGLAAGAVGSGLGPVGTIGAGLAGELIGGYVGATAQDEAAKALGIDHNAVRAANRQAHPWWTAAGAGLSQAAGGAAGLKNAAVSLGGRLFGAGVGGGVETAVQAYHGTPIKEAIPQVIGSTVGGFAFAAPRAPAQAAERLGTSIRHAINPPPPPPPPPPRVGVDQPGVKTSQWTGPPGEVGPHVPPEQGQLPFGQGAAARPPEPPQVRFTPQDAARKEDLTKRWTELSREERAEWHALDQQEIAAAQPQRPQIGGGEAQPELPFPPPPPPPRTGYSKQPELPLEPSPVINAEGQYGFAINAPHPGNQYQHTPPPMPAGAGTAREAAPPPRLKEPDPAPHSAVRRGLFSETPPDAAAGIHVLQPGQIDSTVRHGLAARNVGPRQPPQRYSFEPPRPPAPPPPAPDTSPLPRNQSLAIRPAETTQGMTEPPVPPGHTRMYQGANQPEKQFSPDRSVAARYGAVQFVDVDNRLGKPFFTPMQMGSPEYVSRNPIYRQRLRPVQEMRTGTGQPPEPPTGGSSPPLPPPTPPSSGGPRTSDPNLDARISQAIGPQPPAAPAPRPAAPPANMAILRTKANKKGEPVRLEGDPYLRNGVVYQRIRTRRNIVQGVPANMLGPMPPPKVAKAAPAAAVQTEAKSQQMAREGPKQFPKEPTPEMSPHAREVMEIANQIEATGALGAELANAMRAAAHGGYTKPENIGFYRQKLADLQARNVEGAPKPAEGYTIMDILEAKPLADLEARINDRSTPAAAQMSDLLMVAASRVEQLGQQINDAGWKIGDVHGTQKSIPPEVRQAKKLISEIAGTVSATLSGAKARKGADHVHKTAQNMQRLRALLGESGAPAPPPAPAKAAPAAKPEKIPTIKPEPETPASETPGTELYRIGNLHMEASQKGPGYIVMRGDEVISKPNEWGKAAQAFHAAAVKDGHPDFSWYDGPPNMPVRGTPSLQAKPAPTPKETIAARPAGETVGDALKQKAVDKRIAANAGETPKEPLVRLETKRGKTKRETAETEEKIVGAHEQLKEGNRVQTPEDFKAYGEKWNVDTEKLTTEAKAQIAADAAERGEVAGRRHAATAKLRADRVAALKAETSAKPKETLLTKTSGSRPAVDFIGPLKDDITASHYAHRMAEMRSHKPRPVNKMWRNPDAADPAQVATHEAKIKVWEKEYRAVSANQKLALARDNAAFAERQKTTPKSEPLRRDVTERGPGGRPTRTAPLKIGAEDKILEKGFARTVSGMQEASRMQGARQTAERPSLPDNMNVPAHRRSTEYGLAVRDQQFGKIKGETGDYEYWRAIAEEEGHRLRGVGKPNPFTAARRHSDGGKTAVVINPDGRRTIYRDGERVHRDRVGDPLPTYLIESEPARRSTVEAAARKHGGLEPATEALVKRIQQRVDDIKAGRAAPGSGQVQRLAIRRSDVDKSRAKVAGAAPVKPQIKTHDGAVFTGATIHEAALRAISSGGYRPHQIFNLNGTPYAPPKGQPLPATPAAARRAAAGVAPPAGAAGPPAGGGRTPPPTPPPAAPTAPPPQSAGSVEAAEKSILSRVATRPSWYSSVPTSRAEAKAKWREFYTAAKNAMDPVEQLKKRLTQPISAEDDFAMLARNIKGLGGRFQQIIRNGTYDISTGKVNGKGLDEVIKPVADNPNGFTAYALSKRVIELEGRNIKTGMNLAEAHQIVAARSAQWEPVFRDLVAFQDRVLQNLVRSGVLSDAQANAMRRMNKEYVPFYRLLDPKSELGVQLGSGLQTRNPIFRIKGDESQVFDPIDSIIKNTYVFADLAERNRALVKMKKANDLLPPDKRFMEPDASVRAIEVTPPEIQKWMNKHGIAGIADEAMTIFRPKAFQPEPGKIRLFENGKAKIYKVDENVGAAVNAMDQESQALWLKIMSTPAKMLRAGAVLSPEFMLRNPLRDALTAFIQAKHGSIPVVDQYVGLKHIFKKSEHYQEWLINGGANANLVSMDRNLLKLEARSMGGQVANLVLKPYHWLQMFSELSENATRVGMYTRAREKGVHGIEAAYEAREGTLDFARVGSSTGIRALNSMVPFLNVHLEGLDRAARAFRDNPTGFLAKTTAAITLPSVLLWFRNKDDERVQQLPAWQRDLFWIVTTDNWQPVSNDSRDKLMEALAKTVPNLDHTKLKNTFRKGANGGWEYNNGTIYRIPKPFELGIVFGSIPERILDRYFSSNPDAFRNLSKTVMRAMVPNYVPQAALPFMEHWANRSLFLDRNLLTEKQEKLPPEMQFGPFTTETSKAIAGVVRKVAGDKSSFGSPVIVDNYIRQWTGGLGSHVISLIDSGLKTQQDRAPEPTRTMADIPGIKAFVARSPSSGAEAIQHFYDLRADRKMDAAGLNELMRTDPARARERMKTVSPWTGEPFAQVLKADRDAVAYIMGDKTMSPDNKRAALDLVYLLMIEHAKKGVESIHKTKRPETVR